MKLAARLQDRVQNAYYRSPAARRALTAAFWHRTRGRGYDLGHLRVYQEDDAMGTLQRDEALVLYAMCRALRPRKVAEIGFFYGRGSFNLLQALDPDAHLYAFDIDPEAESIARRHFAGIPQFTFHTVSQDAIRPEHVDGGPLDLVFLDASHDFELNRRTFELLVPLLSEHAVVAVHDTGTWHRERMEAPHHAHVANHGHAEWWLEDAYQHQRDERLFINWVTEEHGEFAALNLHTHRVNRQGLTLLQRRKALPVDSGTGG